LRFLLGSAGSCRVAQNQVCPRRHCGYKISDD
jgi:hypothetical protein